jgi:hypothetical protein
MAAYKKQHTIENDKFEGSIHKMKNLKIKVTTVIMAGVLCLSGFTFAANNDSGDNNNGLNGDGNGFSDMTTHWSNSYVSSLTERGIISGYGDGTFKPDNTLKRIEFIVLTLKALESEGTITLDATAPADTYWGMPYIEKAIEMNLLENYTTAAADYETAITREEMASIIVKAYDTIGGDTAITDGVVTKAQKQIGDLVNVSASYKTEVTTAYALNFIAGYGDGSFKPLGSATRGEASVVISKLLDDSMRTPIEEDKPLEGDSSWLEWVQSQSPEYQEEHLTREYAISTFEDGVLTIVDGGGGYGDLVVKDTYTPDLTARLNNLLNYMARLERFSGLYTTRSPVNELKGHREFILVTLGNKLDYYNRFPYFQYIIYHDHYFDPSTYDGSETQKGATIELTINKLYDDNTNFDDDEFWVGRYDERYMTPLKESVEVFFGEPYGAEIADYVEQTHIDHYAIYGRYDFPYYDVVKTIGNVDIVVPLISKSDGTLHIFFTIH